MDSRKISLQALNQNNSPEINLHNHTALVTGGSKNIGKAIALSLANAGANVIIVVKDSMQEASEVVEEIKKSGVKAAFFVTDISNEENVKNLIKNAKEEFGNIDILVNNAAIRPAVSFLDMSLSDWNNVIATNLTAPFLLIREILPDMIAKNYGRIINISGVDAYYPIPNRVHNIVSKNGLAGLTKAIAKEFGHQGITSNSIAVGGIRTIRDLKHYKWFDKFKKQIEEGNPVPRLGECEEVASLCLFLSSTYSSYITGQTVHINGGLYMN